MENLKILQFKDKSSYWWLNNKVYHLNEKNKIVLICGGKEEESEIESLIKYIKNNKKEFKAREESVVDKEEKVYMTVDFGKYSQQKLDYIVDVDKNYAKWLYNNTNNLDIKTQLKSLLKIK